MSTNSKPNRLAKEKSPYLLQHAYNPVDWFPWSDEAFDKAKAENKPIFLSIGYSTCHWCHVMERESFEDDEVAALLNEHYVAIKVDREERPDIDHIYMNVCQALTGQGGWPLTIVMTPEKKPFFAGTYFPKKQMYGRYGMTTLLPMLADKWEKERDHIEEIGQQIVDEMGKRTGPAQQGQLSEDVLQQAVSNYKNSFDDRYGGFQGAPKFPSSHNLSFLLRMAKRTDDTEALEMVEKTLDTMYRGGMYDHVGGGFARYSTDEKWLVPHFEKMLYDNALLAWTYLEAYQLTGKHRYAAVAEQIFTYVLRDMTDEGGGFYSAEDADSEGVEGKFYVWHPDEIKEVLGEADGTLYCDWFDITEHGNFEGAGIPNLIERSPEQQAKAEGLTVPEWAAKVESMRGKLFAYREQRVHPGKDDKILTAWNGLMIQALALGYKLLGKEAYRDAAVKAADFIQQRLIREDGRLLARYRDGEAAYPAYVDDYAFLTWGLMELYEATFAPVYLERAVQLNQRMLELFWDEEHGGLYFYGSDTEQLFSRNKEVYDGAMPSGNSVAALTMQKLAALTYNAQLSQQADQQLQAFGSMVERYPMGHAMFLIALDYALSPKGEIVIADAPQAEETNAMLALLRNDFRPYSITLWIPSNRQDADYLRRLVPMLEDKHPIGGRTTAYVCENFACQSPVTDAAELAEMLKA